MRANSYKDLNLFFSDRLFLESISEELKLATKEKELEECLIVLMAIYLLKLNFTEGFFKFTSKSLGIILAYFFVAISTILYL